ncbi:hypothetical protein F0562_001854 [Nyssa sinensis]|uniref:Poly [ADP-ribose] polymerase n=1 Tax=Nyssa sinensis TaxID=561372 RepID=A0A5J5C860_9ASTE|nr:hypothetical protein F0562_001854 [Nyssa sinensis]
MKVHETRSHAHSSADEERMITRKQKAAESKGHEAQQSPKKAKNDKDVTSGDANGISTADIAMEFDKFCKATKEHLSVQQMREILEANSHESSGSDDAVVPRCQDMMFYGPLDKCPVCCSTLECSDCLQKSPVFDLLKSHRDPKDRPQRDLGSADKPFAGMIICLSGRLSRTHQYWKSQIEKHGGKVSNSAIGATCVVLSPAERQRGGSSKVAEALERDIPVVREAWLEDSIEKREAQPLDAYDALSDLTTYGRGIPWDTQDPSEEAIESLSAEVKVYGKRGVHKDTELQEKGGKIFEKDGILYNCAFSVCDQGRGVNDYCVMQLIMVPENHLYMYYKKGRVGDDARADERLEEWDNEDNAVKEFARLFEELTGNEFEPWEKEKIQKKRRKFYPIDMDDGVDVRHGGLGLRQLGIAVAHSKLEPFVANFMRVLCSQEIYRYAMMEMALDSARNSNGNALQFPFENMLVPPSIPPSLNRVLKRLMKPPCPGEEVLLPFVERLKSLKETVHKAEAVWSDFSQRWFTLLHSTRPFIFHDYQDLADHAATVLESVRDITVASHLIGDMTGPTIDDPLFDRYKKLGCSISALEKDSEDYKMILNYLEKTYEPVKVGDISYGVSVDNIFAVESSACSSWEEMKNLPNKVLLWFGTQTSNLLRHLQKGFLPAICSLPVPGYMFGRAIVCTDAAAEAARYGSTAVDRPEGFLILAVASLGEQITEFKSLPEDTKSLEEKKMGVKGLGRTTTDESEHFVWKDDIKVPCGLLVPSGYKDSPLEYNEYAVYDPKQVSIRFVVSLKFEEKNEVMDTEE